MIEAESRGEGVGRVRQEKRRPHKAFPSFLLFLDFIPCPEFLKETRRILWLSLTIHLPITFIRVRQFIT